MRRITVALGMGMVTVMIPLGGACVDIVGVTTIPGVVEGGSEASPCARESSCPGDGGRDADGAVDVADGPSADVSESLDASEASTMDAVTCSPTATRCSSDSQMETCGATGWGSPRTCGSGACSGGACTGATTGSPSCETEGLGMTNCGLDGGESCCTSLEVTNDAVDGGASYYRTYTNSGGDAGPTGEADPATVNGFRLDKYLVTVGRFRQFVTAWSQQGYFPSPGSGKHTHLNDGKGLANSGSPGSYEEGWLSSWDDAEHVAPTDTNLGTNCDSAKTSTWTPDTGGNENLPINCETWWEAYAFCIWDGGFLPSEAEWEYAAAGGNQQREYPWGSTDPGATNEYAIYGGGPPYTQCYYPTGTLAPCSMTLNFAPVGHTSLGAGNWGQLDLAGEVWEWNLDWFAPYVDPCIDCAYLTTQSQVVIRGGSFNGNLTSLLPAHRKDSLPDSRVNSIGIRCARTP
jgi:formylglycine-generating enzyme